MMTNSKNISDVPPMTDEELEKFGENNQPEDFPDGRKEN
jgi:hypothetical protein